MLSLAEELQTCRLLTGLTDTFKLLQRLTLRVDQVVKHKGGNSIQTVAAAYLALAGPDADDPGNFAVALLQKGPKEKKSVHSLAARPAETVSDILLVILSSSPGLGFPASSLTLMYL